MRHVYTVGWVSLLSGSDDDCIVDNFCDLSNRIYIVIKDERFKALVRHHLIAGREQ